MKRKNSILVTENNINEIYGRLKKFFYNKNNSGFITWHNYDCAGFKGKIKKTIDLSDSMLKHDYVKIEREFPAPLNIALKTKNPDECIYKTYILCSLDANHGLAIYLGDRISFRGNKIIIRGHALSIFDNKKYLYSVYQMIPMSKKVQDEMHDKAEYEKQLYDEEFEENF